MNRYSTPVASSLASAFSFKMPAMTSTPGYSKYYVVAQQTNSNNNNTAIRKMNTLAIKTVEVIQHIVTLESANHEFSLNI